MSGPMDFDAVIRQILDYSDNSETDILVYYGDIDRSGYDALCHELPAYPKQNCLFVLCTNGGDPDAGFRIARALSHTYDRKLNKTIKIMVPSFCKSAGTLICIGAQELIIGDCGELGPLDVQVRKHDEMFQRGSGLDMIRGLNHLRDETLSTFVSYLIPINGSGLSTKYASDIATKLTIGVYEPIFAQIDPIKLGDMQASLDIAMQYGKRLDERGKNLQENALEKLINDYPSHGFVIDRKEARELFKNVRQPTDIEQTITQLIDVLCNDSKLIISLSEWLRQFASSSPRSDTQGVDTHDKNTDNPEPGRGDTGNDEKN